MNRITRILFSVVLCCWMINSVYADDRPNIIVILCDDLGYGDLGCYGHPHIKTPVLDQLAADGIRFTSCYSAAPVCSPSRVGLLTGRSPNRAGVYDWIPPGNRRRADAREQVHMRRHEITIAKLLKDAGYSTCMAGKWHCNSLFNNDAQPQPGDFGFDHWMATQNNASPTHKNPMNYVRNGKSVGKVEGFSCEIAATEVIDWLAKADRGKPFFVFLPFHEPHEPVASPEDLVKEYLNVSRDEDEAQYFANVSNVDRAVGKLVDALDKMKLRENTLIVFTSDNGPETLDRYRSANRSYGTPGPLRGMKLHTTDAGFRVAGIMNWRGRIKGGAVSDATVSSLDFLPTFCQLAKRDLPEGVALDGTNFLPALEGKAIERKKPLVWAYFNALNERRVAMREGKYKVLAKLNGGKLPKFENVTPKVAAILLDAKLTDVEIYDVTNDIAEKHDLAKSNPELAKSMTAKLDENYRELMKDSHVWKPETK